jgi:ABC-type glycerol-3-phosphate transport system substrate-binding protein
MAVSRRDFLYGSVGSAAVLGLAACSSVHSDSNSADTSAPKTPASAPPTTTNLDNVKGTLTFAFWGGSEGEKRGFTYAKEQFEKAHPGTKINLKIVPYDGFFSGIDRQITAGNAPDVFRVDYTTIGKYSKNGVLLDMTPYFDQSEISAFLPALWDGIKYNGTPYGVPHQTDTTCIVYNKKAFETAGITSVPTKLDDAWTWEEFGQVAAKLRKTLPNNKYPFAYDWTAAGAFRWLSWLYQAGGTLLTPDLKKCALPSDAATQAMDFTKSFFDKKWVPANNTIKTSTYSDNFFLSQTVPMTFIGDFLVPELADPKSGYKGGSWGATYMPQDKSTASDLGGNAIVALKSTKNPDLAAAFLKFLVTEDAMKYFCEQAVELPTLQSLASADLNYAYRPDVVAVCAQQATTISDTIVKESTVGGFADINTALQDQLELAFHGQNSSTTISQIAAKVNKAIGA